VSIEVEVTSRDFSMTLARRVRVELSWFVIITGFKVSVLFLDVRLELDGGTSPVALCLCFRLLLVVSVSLAVV
jgi:hypothetical protein